MQNVNARLSTNRPSHSMARGWLRTFRPSSSYREPLHRKEKSSSAWLLPTTTHCCHPRCCPVPMLQSNGKSWPTSSWHICSPCRNERYEVEGFTYTQKAAGLLAGNNDAYGGASSSYIGQPEVDVELLPCPHPSRRPPLSQG